MTKLKQIIEVEKESILMINEAYGKQENEINRVRQIIEKERHEAQQDIDQKVHQLEKEKKESIEHLKVALLTKKEKIDKMTKNMLCKKSAEIIERLYEEIVNS